MVAAADDDDETAAAEDDSAAVVEASETVEAAAAADDCEAACDEAEPHEVAPVGLAPMVTAWAKLVAPVESLMARVLRNDERKPRGRRRVSFVT